MIPSEMIKLTYGPVLTTINCSDPNVLEDLFRSLRVDNPNYDPKSDNPGPPYIEFFDREKKAVLTGLVSVVAEWCLKQDLSVELIKFPDLPKVKAQANAIPGLELRPYQLEALQKALDGVRGVLEIATGGGKTEIAIALVLTLGKPKTLYMTPDTASMDEMYNRFVKRGFLPGEVGRLGAGYDQTDRPVTIAVVNSLYSGIKRSYPKVLELLRTAEVFFSDEVHHSATAFSWQVVAAECQATRRIGMSGTPYKDSKSRFNPGYLHPYDTWLTGHIGTTLVHISPAELQDKGQLAKCRVLSFEAGGSWIRSQLWQKVYSQGIIHNSERNFRISTLAANIVDTGGRPLISVEKLEHGRMLQRLIKNIYNIDSVCSYGSGVVIVSEAFAAPFRDNFEVTPIPVYKKDGSIKGYEEGYVYLPNDFPFRKYFQDGTVGVLIGSKIYDEALDIPCLTDLINAAGGKAEQRLRQKIGRILRLFKNKELSRVWEPFDDCHFYLENHSRKRLKIAEEEGYEIVPSPPLCTELRFKETKVKRSFSMKMKEIEVEVGMTVNIAEYQNIKPCIRLRGLIEEGDDLQKCYEELSAHATQLFFREAWSQAYQFGQCAALGVEQAAKNYLNMFKKDG